MKVLLAEDSRTNQILIRSYIEEAGHEIIISNNGEEAIEQFIEMQPDLVLMDLIMPVMDGIDAAIEIRKICESRNDWTPIIFLSAMTEGKDIVRAIEAGGDDYLTKPVDPVVLNAKLLAMQRIGEMRQELKNANLELRLMSVKDGLTGIANRRYFDEVLDKEIKRAMRLQSPLSFILCDIDSFKPYNDNYGHQAGDECLKNIARRMAHVSRRPGDLVARYGGEEFAIILPETTLEGAIGVAEGIREAINDMGLPHAFSVAAPHVTISVGVATIFPDSSDDVAHVSRSIIYAADKALYQAKENGRNQVAVWQKPKGE